MPAHILPGTRAVHLLAPCWCAPTFLASKILVRLAGSRPPGRVSLGMESAGRAHPVRSGLALGSGAIRLSWQGGSTGSSGTVSAEWEGRNMHTCIQKATQHVTEHRHAVTRPCRRALSSPVSARARPLCLLPSGPRRAAAATSPTRADLPRPRRWRGHTCTAGAGAERGATQRAHERRRRRLARAELGGVGRGTTCSACTIGSERAARR